MSALLPDGGPRVSARFWQLGSYWSFAVALSFLALFLLGLGVARAAGIDVDSDQSTVGPLLIKLPLVTIAAMLSLAACTTAVRPALGRERSRGYTTLPYSDLPVDVRDWKTGEVLRDAEADPIRRRSELRARLRAVRTAGTPTTSRR